MNSTNVFFHKPMIYSITAFLVIAAFDLWQTGSFGAPILYLVILFTIQTNQTKNFYIFLSGAAIVLTLLGLVISLSANGFKLSDQSLYTIVSNHEIVQRSLTVIAILAWVYSNNTYNRHTEKLIILSNTDGLTGLFNRREFTRITETEIQRATRFDFPLTILFFDIDDFKAVNDSYGHGVGDKALRTISNITRRTLRLSDIVARYGGEEFIIAMPQSSQEESLMVAERLRKNIAKENIFVRNYHFNLTVSIGLAEWQKGDETLDQLIERADAALYEAKRSGKNCVCIAKIDSAPLANVTKFSQEKIKKTAISRS